ncbi:hypothetical protein [Paenibacillus humicola]|uniref:hypothetical protein n=1 Tax=Paenibacillus humicola TaxID=3110540 RepID=UPI00237B9135|nr:hypothetical protein [Paenibacillus humicola]
MLKSFKKRSAYLLIALCGVLGIASGGTLAGAEAGPAAYNYSFWGDTAASPAAYQATALINGENLKIGAFKDPSDIQVTANQIYVLDSGNNRVVVLNSQFKLVHIIDSFVREGKKDTFKNPQGLFVTNDKHVYVADTGNLRVVHLNPDDKLAGIIENPKSELLQAGFKFQPVRIAVDKARRIYAMAAGVFDGLMEFSADGTFTSFMGANRVSFSPVDYFWKMVSTKAQRSQMVMFTPTEFTNLDINDEDFIYVTNGQESDNVKKLNAQGNDILRKEGYFPPEGDIRYTPADGPSRIIDIDVADSEIFSILDSKRGRIFTYNGDGYLMYVFGGLGNQMGEFKSPAAIERIGDDFLVLDQALGEITVFQTTDYGRTLNDAVRSYYNGDEERSFQLFQKTINMNANLEFAYDGIGKALLRKGEYAEAMKYFKQSKDQPYYSKAFLLYRKQVLRKYFPALMTTILILAICAFLLKKIRKIKGGKKLVSTQQRAG